MLLGRSALPSVNLSFMSCYCIYLVSSLFDRFSNLEMTVLLSPSFIFFVQPLIMESLVWLKHFNLRKSQIMINCILGKLKSLLAI